MTLSDTQTEATDSIAAFSQGLGELGGALAAMCGSNIALARAMPDVARRIAAELTALTPDIILASGTLAVAGLQQLPPSIPVVFTVVTDPVAAGFVDSIAHPGGNMTGFMQSEYSLHSKLLELLKELVP